MLQSPMGGGRGNDRPSTRPGIQNGWQGLHSGLLQSSVQAPTPAKSAGFLTCISKISTGVSDGHGNGVLNSDVFVLFEISLKNINDFWILRLNLFPSACSIHHSPLNLLDNVSLSVYESLTLIEDILKIYFHLDYLLRPYLNLCPKFKAKVVRVDFKHILINFTSYGITIFWDGHVEILHQHFHPKSFKFPNPNPAIQRITLRQATRS